MKTNRRGYRAIADHYRHAITAGHLAPGDRLPTHTEATKIWGVSKQTITRAYAELRRDGLTTGTTGTGTLVADYHSADMASRVREHALTGDALAAGETSQILAVGEVPAPPPVATRLGIDPGSPVWERRRRVARDGTVTHVSTSYYPPQVNDAVPELRRRESTGGSRELASERLGVPQDHVLQEARPMLADPSSARDLGVNVGDPLIGITRTVWLADGTIVEVAQKLTHMSVKWTTNLRQ